MQPTIEELRPRLHAFDFRGLFVEVLGWNNYVAAPFTVHDGGHDYTLTPVAEKANFVVWECGPGPDGAIPEMPARRRIEAQAEKLAHEHLIVFTDAQRAAQVWQWVKREHGKAAAYRNFQYRSGDSGTPLLQRLRGIAFALEEEGRRHHRGRCLPRRQGARRRRGSRSASTTASRRNWTPSENS